MQSFSRLNPFLASIKQRVCLCGEADPEKRVFHLVLDLKGSDLNYKVGDSVGVLAKNLKEDVDQILHCLSAKEDEKVTLKDGQCLPLRQFLEEKANIATVNKKLIQKVLDYAVCDKKKEELKFILTADDETFKAFVAVRHVWDFLADYLDQPLSPQEFIAFLQPLMPRFYSIASSKETVGEEVHLLIADVEYETNNRKRRGVASSYLCQRVALHSKEIPIFIQSSHSFSLTDKLHAPLIMIGPGTGVAPFIGFMQERVSTSASFKNWLFFGERNEKEHYFFKENWKKLVDEKRLVISTAFSRDQKEKIYVQHRMKEEAEQLFNWIQEGAHIYVCGDASRMAKDVETTLLEIFQEQGKLSQIEARDYLKRLRAEKRYQRDVY